MPSMNTLHCFILTTYSGIMSAHQIDSPCTCAMQPLGGGIQRHMLTATKEDILCYWHPMQKCNRNFGGSKKDCSLCVLKDQSLLSFVSDRWMSITFLFWLFFGHASIRVLSGPRQLKMALLNLMEQKCFNYCNYSLNSSIYGKNEMKWSSSHLTTLKFHRMSSVGHTARVIWVHTSGLVPHSFF